MWQLHTLPINAQVIQYKIHRKGAWLSFNECLTLFRENAEFRQFYRQALLTPDFSAYFWEVRPFTHQQRHEPFEWVVVHSAHLAQVLPDKAAFAEYFRTSQPVVAFPNLGGDARLVVPRPEAEEATYSHLARFVHQAPHAQWHALWQVVGQQMAQAMGSEPRWLSTSGLGVYWLHIRIDSRPKYYQHTPYHLGY